MDCTALVMLFAFLLSPCVLQEWGRSAYKNLTFFRTVVECWTMYVDCSKHLMAMLKLHLMHQQSLYMSSNQCKIGILHAISCIKRQHYIICSIQTLEALLDKLKNIFYLISYLLWSHSCVVWYHQNNFSRDGSTPRVKTQKAVINLKDSICCRCWILQQHRPQLWIL